MLLLLFYLHLVNTIFNITIPRPGSRAGAIYPMTITIRGDIQITEKQLTVAQLLADGYTTNEIASMVHISPRTVESYRVRLVKATKSFNTTHMIVKLMRNKVIK